MRDSSSRWLSHQVQLDHAGANTPAETVKCICRSLPSRRRTSPNPRRVGLRIPRFEACSAFTRVPACVLAELPKAVPGRPHPHAAVAKRRGQETPGCIKGNAHHATTSDKSGSLDGAAEVGFRAATAPDSAPGCPWTPAKPGDSADSSTPARRTPALAGTRKASEALVCDARACTDPLGLRPGRTGPWPLGNPARSSIGSRRLPPSVEV
jgi:hypothetical protein